MQQAILHLPVSLAIASGKAQAAASNAEGHIDKQSAIAKSVGDVSEVASSGGPHSAAPSNRVDEVESSSSGVAQSAATKQLPSHTGRVLNTGSSDAAHEAMTLPQRWYL